jgi:CRISPR-associated protein Csx10
MHQLRYTLELRRPAILAAQTENPNFVLSQGYVPGSALLGAAAAAFIANAANGVTPGQAHHKSDFASWFLRGNVMFLNAYPADASGRRLLPSPLSLLSDKVASHEIFDLSDPVRLALAQTEERRLIPISGYAHFEQSNLSIGEPRKRVRYHHARPNRMKGRADENEGSLFVYEALESGQKMAGRILGEDTVLQQFLQATGWGKGDINIWFGRSRTAEYGGDAILHLQSTSPEPFKREPEDGAAAEETIQPGSLVVTLLSPLISRSETARLAVFPLDELAAALHDSGVTPHRVERSYCRQIWIGGYSRIWNLPRPQLPAFAAGSVFVIEMKGKPDAKFKLAFAEMHSLGERTGEGFGRIALNWHTPLSIEKREDEAVKLWKPPLPNTKTPPAAFLHIYRESRCRLLMDSARSRGLEHGNQFKPLSPEEGVAASQLGRVIHTLRNTQGMETLKALLTSLRRPAKEQLSASRMNGKSLLEVLSNYKERPGDIQQYLDVSKPDAVSNLPEDHEIGMSNEELARVYLLSLCSQMARLKRRPQEVKE